MSDTLTMEPEATAREEVEAKDPVVALRLLIPVAPATEWLFPPSSRFATYLLERVLLAALQIEAGPVLSHAAAFPVGRCFCSYTLGGGYVEPALQALRAELEILKISHVAQIAWLDHKEDVWRLWHPHRVGLFDAPSEAEILADAAAVEKSLLEFRGWLPDGGNLDA